MTNINARFPRRASGSATVGMAMALCLVPASAWAAPPAGDAGGEASASLSATTAGDAEAETESSTRGNRNDKWIRRWAPERNMFEIGAYGGAIFPNIGLELFADDPDKPSRGYRPWPLVGPEFGLRFAYLPLRHFGVEAEGGAMPMKVGRTDTASATMYTVRGHLIGQLGLWSVTPFILFGVGALGVDSGGDAVGNDVDIAPHFGGGLKFFINRYIMLRLDGRGIISNRRGVGDGVIVTPEILAGLSVTLGRERDRPRKSPRDRDGDGVVDGKDLCPDVPGAPPSGCPTVCLPDDDADKVPNATDECPEEPETRNGFLDDDGCPDEVPQELTDLSGIMKGINFDTDKDTIKRGSMPVMERALEVLKKFPELRVEISGHTDSRGGYQHNMDLSRRRAESVKRWLVENGIEETRIKTRGAGPDEAIDTNDTSEGRFNNRRIEFKILEGGPVSGDDSRKK